MAEATLTTVGALLKEVYGPRIEKSLNDEIVTLKRIERSSDGVTERAGGKYVDFPIHVGRNSGISYRQEWEALAPAGRQRYEEVHVPLYYGYGRVKFSSQVMELAEKDFQSFSSAMDQEMSGIKNDLAKDSNRIVYGDGSGALASVATTMGAAGNSFVVGGTNWLEVGSVIDILTNTGTVLAAVRTVTAINLTTKTVTVDGATFTAIAGTHFVYRTGNFSGGVQREPSGLGKIVSATLPLHGLDPATVPQWAANVTGTVGALSEGAMIKMCDDVRMKGGGKITAIFTSLGVRREYFYLLTQQRRYTDTKSFDGGLQGLAFNYGSEVPVVEDVDHPNGVMHFLNEKTIKVYRTKPWHWGDADGNTLKWVTGFDGWEGYIKQYWEIGTSRRNSHGKLTGITEDGPTI